MTIQLARFEKPLATLEALFVPEALAPERIDATIDEAVKRDSRGRIFALEGLVRLYDGIHETLEPLLGPIKAAEDAIGAYTERTEYLDFANAVGAPAPVIEVLSASVRDARARLRQEVPAIPKALAQLRAALGATEWLGEEDDARAVIGEMARELRKYARLAYDPEELQSGIHEMRRNLRWFLVYVQALDGLILLEKGEGPIKVNAYSYLETHPIAQSRFSKVAPNPALRWVTSISNAYFLALSKVVNELGEVKSQGEAVEALGHAFEETGAPDGHEQAIALAAKRPGYVASVPRAARRILQELEQTKLLKRIRKQLRAGLRETATPPVTV